MKALIIYMSIHHGNTEKIAKAMAEELGAEIRKPGEVEIASLSAYDLIGFGSGIYFWKHHKALLELADKLPAMRRKAFIFSTSGQSGPSSHRALKEKLQAKGFEVVGEFHCKGWDTWGPNKLVGGLSKGRPSEKDLEDARAFARGLAKAEA
jgi:flavodoxin